MRTTTLVLIVAGVVVLAIALWLATVMPIRRDVVNLNSDNNSEATHTLYLNLWGTPVRKSFVQLYRSKEGMAREVHVEGNTMGVNNHGPCIHRERINGGDWTAYTFWCIDGKVVTEQEWDEYCRRR